MRAKNQVRELGTSEQRLLTMWVCQVLVVPEYALVTRMLIVHLGSFCLQYLQQREKYRDIGNEIYGLQTEGQENT